MGRIGGLFFFGIGVLFVCYTPSVETLAKGELIFLLGAMISFPLGSLAMHMGRMLIIGKF